MSQTCNPPDVNPREDRYDGSLPAYGITFLRERVFRVLRDGPLHAHRDQTQMLVVLAGRLALRLDSVQHALSPGKAIVVPVGASHYLAATGSHEPLTLIDLRVLSGAHHDVGRLLEAIPAGRPLTLAQPGLSQAAAAIADATVAAGWRRAPGLLSSLWELVSALELPETEAPLVGQQSVSDYRLRRAETFILQNLGDEIGVEDIAQAAKISRSQLTRLYRKELGMGPAERLRQCRVAVARRLLASGRLSVKEVARAVGFPWVHHFIRTYRTLRGHTPSVDLGVDD